jgi:pyruvate/2-oxoglutarate dehydrogenase complex dihydrolipoamide acyltransferase (E2) component
MTHKIILPEMGEGVFEGTLTRWLVQPGDKVEAFEPVAEVETDKVTTELMSEVSGVVLELRAAEGEVVPVDAVVAVIGQESDEVEPVPSVVKDRATNGQNRNYPEREYRGRISPVVGRIAAEHNVDLNRVLGTGKGGRITKRDILAYVEERPLQPVASANVDESREKEIDQPERQEEKIGTDQPIIRTSGDELLPLDSMRRAIANHMVRSKQASPHATTVFEFDFSAVAKHRAENKEKFLKDGARLTFTVYIVAAVVDALKDNPLANSVWTDEGILLKRPINIGMAVAISDGLIVPVIKGADGLNLLGLARRINDLAERARDKALKPDEVQGGTFSITNHGTSGSLLATPIINQPQAGILGIGKIEKRVKVINDAIAIRPLAYASFTFDHRILDGATADAFVISIKNRIESWV